MTDNHIRELELLAPAKNKDFGIQAIIHGADAVYIGARHHGARAAAGNDIEDIKELCEFAHKYKARVYVTINTLVYDDELEDVKKLIRELAMVHVDALLVQDMALVEIIQQAPANDPLSYFKPRLHASTQTDNRTSQKVSWLHSVGFSRVVLARETTLADMKNIHEANEGVELEAFVHGALCVSYSGLCYASQYCFKRSANRGECAQFCRMKFDLVDSDGNVIAHNRYMLSLKDMCQIENIEDMAAAGITSFKIEGRLKDISYVKNVVAAYSQKLDAIVKANPAKYRRSSIGSSKYGFTPDLDKTFNRGYTTYCLKGRTPNISSPVSPKAMGKYIGKVKEIRRDSFNVSTIESLANGDGLCFISRDQELVGFRANKVVGNRVFPLKMPESIESGTVLYRNSDQTFDKLLSGTSAERKIAVSFVLFVDNGKIVLQSECCGTTIQASLDNDFQLATKPQEENIRKQLTKLGNTVYECKGLEIKDNIGELFIPSSMLAALRRNLVDKMDAYMQEESMQLPDASGNNEVGANDSSCVNFYPAQGYLYNIANSVSSAFYTKNGLEHQEKAYEIKEQHDAKIMQCKYCIRYAYGFCVKNGGAKPTWKEPLYLVLGDKRRFRLEFECSKCQMNVRVDNNKTGSKV